MRVAGTRGSNPKPSTSREKVQKRRLHHASEEKGSEEGRKEKEEVVSQSKEEFRDLRSDAGVFYLSTNRGAREERLCS
jgi:hypothetical protein